MFARQKLPEHWAELSMFSGVQSYRDNPAAPTEHTEPQMLSASGLIKTQTFSSPENSNIGFHNRVKIHKQTVTYNLQIILFGCVKLSSFNIMKI